jgi:hypothetical protein
LFLQPVLSASYHLIRPRTREEIRPVIQHVGEHYQDGDMLYLYYASQPAFRYYSESYGFDESDYIVGVSSRDNWQNYIKELDEFRGHERVWILFSHVCNWQGVDEERFFLYHLDSIGTRLDSFGGAGAAVYLYDLGDEASNPARERVRADCLPRLGQLTGGAEV